MRTTQFDERYLSIHWSKKFNGIFSINTKKATYQSHYWKPKKNAWNQKGKTPHVNVNNNTVNIIADILFET